MAGKDDIWFTAVIILGVWHLMMIMMVFYGGLTSVSKSSMPSQELMCFLGGWIFVIPIVVVGLWEKISEFFKGDEE